MDLSSDPSVHFDLVKELDTIPASTTPDPNQTAAAESRRDRVKLEERWNSKYKRLLTRHQITAETAHSGIRIAPRTASMITSTSRVMFCESCYLFLVESWDTPPHPGDEHFDLGVWHESALPADVQNRDGYLMLKQQVYETACDVEESYSDIAVAAVSAFHEEVVKLVDAIPDEEICSRSWSWLCCCNPVYNLI